MPEFLLSANAKSDLLSIARYTQKTWSEAQAKKYIQQLQFCLAHLADNPQLGHPFDTEKPHLRRFNQGSHVVFFRRRNADILIIRILHGRMLPKLHLPEI